MEKSQFPAFKNGKPRFPIHPFRTLLMGFFSARQTVENN